MILKVEHDLEQCAHIPWQRGQNHSHNHLGQNKFIKVHTSYSKGQRKKKHGEWTKAKTNACQSKVTSILGWKSSMKGGILTLASGWRMWRIPMVSLNGVTYVLGANARTVWTYSPTWTMAPTQCNHVDGGEVGSGVNSKGL